MFLILRIAVNIVFAAKVEDMRSDDEESENELEKKERVAKGETVAVKNEVVGHSTGVTMNGNATHGVNGSAHRHGTLKQEKKAG
jgi:hypothetical protein